MQQIHILFLQLKFQIANRGAVMKAIVLFAVVIFLTLTYDGSAFLHSSTQFGRVQKIQQFRLPASAAVTIKLQNIKQAEKLITQAASSTVVTKAAVKAVAKLLSTCGLGIWASKAGILDQNAVAVLSKLIFSVFQPCLLFVNVASTVANIGSGGGNPAAIYLLPIAAAVQILVGYIVGKVVSLVMNGGKAEDESSKQLLACTTFANSGPLPLVFTDGLFRNHPDTTLLPKSVAYVSLYLLGWSPLFWIVGPAILQENTPHGQPVDKKEQRNLLLKRIFSPPVIGSLLGMVVGFTPFLRRHIISSSGLLNPIFESMRTLGTAYLPAVLLVLAGSLLQNPSTPPATPASTTGTTASSPPSNTTTSSSDDNMIMKLAAVYFARFLLMPVVAFSLYKLSVQWVAGSKALFAKDPLLLLVLLLEACMPSAQNTTVILQLQGAKTAAARLARTLMIIYVLGVPAISFWLVKILQLTGLAA
jgi:predicted permease